MKFKLFYIFALFQLMILHSARAQVVDHELDPRSRYILHVLAKIQSQSDANDDSSLSKISVVPIVVFGVGGFLLGGIIGAQIDQGGPFEITNAEEVSMAVGTAVGITVGYVLARKSKVKGAAKIQK
jgi:hypothetical protein